MKKIVAFEVQPHEAGDLKSLEQENELVLISKPLRLQNVEEFVDAEIICPFVYSQLDARVLSKLPKLGLVATRSTGYDHIDVQYCRAQGILICNVPTYGENTVAEHVFALLLTISHRLSEADILTLHVPATPETNNMLSDREFSAMKKGVVLINTARGSLIDPRALIRALRDGKIAAAGLDVMPDEPMIREEAELICSFYCGRHDLRNLIADHVLLKMPNVIVTPHSAFNTTEAVGRISKTTVKNIEAFLEGKPQNIIR